MRKIHLVLWDNKIIDAELPEKYAATHYMSLKLLFPELYEELIDERDTYIGDHYGKWKYIEYTTE